MGLRLRIVCLVSCSFGLSLSTVWAADSKLFLIHSYAPNPWTTGIREGLLSSPKLKALSLREYYFDTDYWLKQGELAKAKDDKLNTLLHEITPDDLVIVSDDEAATVVLPQLAKASRVLVIGINDVSTSPLWSAFCSGERKHAILFEDYPYKEALTLALKRFPKIQEIHAIGGDTTTSRAMIRGLSQFLSERKRQLGEAITSRDWSTWRSKLQSWDKPNGLTWIFVPFGVRDTLNEEIAPPQIGHWIKEHTSQSRVGALALGGSLDVTIGLDPKTFGVEAAEIAERLLGSAVFPCRSPSRSYKLVLNSRRKK